jgi:hypothetical protein
MLLPLLLCVLPTIHDGDGTAEAPPCSIARCHVTAVDLGSLSARHPNGHAPD